MIRILPTLFTIMNYQQNAPGISSKRFLIQVSVHTI